VKFQVGLELAYLIKKLRDEHGLRPEDVHLIGHSLGAHLSAYAAERVPNIGRITALDPAEPYFQGMGTQVRLDPSDALVRFDEFCVCRLVLTISRFTVCRRYSHRRQKFLPTRDSRLWHVANVRSHRFLPQQWQRTAWLCAISRKQRSDSAHTH
jgi:pimeloyl-ACP methyl ester carboxylesterase